MDFYQVRERETKTGTEVYPDFVVRPSKDLMVRGGSFYAVWHEKLGLWSTDEYDVQHLIDADLYAHAERLTGPVIVRALSSYRSKMWQEFRSYVGNMPNSHQQLDGTLAFADTPPRKGDYSSKRLTYSVKEGSIQAYDRMMSVLFAPEERQKLEWAIGAIVSGDSTKIQKFFVLYGEAGTGKSTFLNILQQLFSGYDTAFDAKALTGTSNAFSTEAFKTNPLVAIQHDGDLSKIEDNTRLNSIVSHEEIIVNEKYRSPYTAKINALLFIGTNQSVKITDAKSGLIRRLIDVHPTGDRFPPNEYEALRQGIKFETGAIAHHCLQVYRKLGPSYYSRYRPMDMIIRTDMFYNFLLENFELFKGQDGTTLKQAWLLYKAFCDEGGFDWRLNQSKFRDELRNYFDHFVERGRVEGNQVWNLFTGFRTDKIGVIPVPEEASPSLELDSDRSILDEMLAEMPAQYANEAGTPNIPWAKVDTTLAGLSTNNLHYVKPGLQHVVIDFDLKDANGDKSLPLNLEAASLWPPTYAELSQGGSGIHLHYVYDGDIVTLSSIYGEGIEVKTFPGDASLRRRLSKCNTIPVATISGGLPLKEKRMLDSEVMKSERALRDLINRNLRKDIHPGTKSSVDFIWKILEDAWNSGMPYDVTDMRGRILAFANGSTNHSVYCVKLVQSMKFASEIAAPAPKDEPSDERLVFFDVEVFPNLFVVCWKFEGDATVVRMLNPSPHTIEDLIKMRLVGFNCRRYDNHILYARIMGYTEYNLYLLSQRITSGDSSGMFGDAYNLSYADIYDFSSLKQSLKRFQIELGLDHKELGLPWDQEVDPAKWEQVADYCANDVITTEQVFNERKQDYVARQILASLSGLTVNDTTQRHTAKIIFGDDRDPQKKFVYTNLSERFPGYHYEAGKSTYQDEVAGEGGYVYAEPGMYSNVAVLDVASMHPTSIEVLDLFGPYTKKYSELKQARIAIKRKDYAGARKLLGGALDPYLGSEEDAKALSFALKIVINIVYGLTAASFSNPFRDPRNKDNIVAKRGALFMIDLKNAVRAQGFRVIHIKTDSIKIPDATQQIVDFVTDFGKGYGYDFEHEVTYEKFCLVNDAVYVAKDNAGEWHATGAQFQEPYVFKTLFSGEEVTFEDLVQIKTVTAALYLDFGSGEPHFVGRAGAFVPVVKGTGGGSLLRGKDGQFHAAGGTKGYEWREATIVRELGLENDIDKSYYVKLADAALANISQYGDAEWFRS
jgi:energy-coupling factor transporter ATP-binding protein EcfA2